MKNILIVGCNSTLVSSVEAAINCKAEVLSIDGTEVSVDEAQTFLELHQEKEYVLTSTMLPVNDYIYTREEIEAHPFDKFIKSRRKKR